MPPGRQTGNAGRHVGQAAIATFEIHQVRAGAQRIKIVDKKAQPGPMNVLDPHDLPQQAADKGAASAAVAGRE